MKSVINIPASVDICRTILHTKFPYCDHLTKLVFLVKKKRPPRTNHPTPPPRPYQRKKNPQQNPNQTKKTGVHAKASGAALCTLLRCISPSLENFLLMRVKGKSSQILFR